MGGGHQFEIEAMREKKKVVQPIWAGIGCLMIVGLTTGGYLLGGWLITANSQKGWIALPAELAWPPQNPFLLVKLGLALIVLLIGSAAISIVYVLINPPKPGKFDVTDSSIFPPPPKRRK